MIGYSQKRTPRIISARRAAEVLEPRVLLSTYYVDDTGGSDAAAGSSAAPWLTLDRAAHAVATESRERPS